jgi:K+-sensing histidine kinase KdpD
VITLTERIFPVNATTVGFAYLLLVLIVASKWGFIEAAFLSIAATLIFNYFFFPPVGTFHITETQNWVALFTFLTTSLIASRLSTKAKQRALDALERQQHIEQLYSFSRAILLIDNAAKYSPPGSPLRIRVQQDGESLTVEITDFGKGIPIPEQDRIFERFYRSPSVGNQIPGSGLGLNIARSIARAHGGDLMVASSPGESTLKLIMPLECKGEHLERGSNFSH